MQWSPRPAFLALLSLQGAVSMSFRGDYIFFWSLAFSRKSLHVYLFDQESVLIVSVDTPESYWLGKYKGLSHCQAIRRGMDCRRPKEVPVISTQLYVLPEKQLPYPSPWVREGPQEHHVNSGNSSRNKTPP